MDDRPVVELQIGRTARSPVNVRSRCHLGLPVVIDVPPLLDDGTPFPTTHWLTCPLAQLRISRIESSGGVQKADADLLIDSALAAEFAETNQRYATDRDSLIPEDWTGAKPSGGVAGSRGGVKCLHAQYADTAAGNQNPIGERVAAEIEPLDCSVGCVIGLGSDVVMNESWTEPV